MIALIDADSLCYVIGWIYREQDLEATAEVKHSCDNMLREILTITSATKYIGAFSPSVTFRHSIYKRNVYKGNRKEEKPEWLTRWMPVVKDHFRDAHGFICIENIEADDVVSGLSHTYKMDGQECIIVSPDKDLQQVPGNIYVPKKETGGGTIQGRVSRISEEEADRFFWEQMLIGDENDNVCGVPGIGPVKARKCLEDCLDPILYASMVKLQYLKYYGDYYGDIIFRETRDTLMMLCPSHDQWFRYHTSLFELSLNPQTLKVQESFFDILSS